MVPSHVEAMGFYFVFVPKESIIEVCLKQSLIEVGSRPFPTFSHIHLMQQLHFQHPFTKEKFVFNHVTSFSILFKGEDRKKTR